MSVPTALIIPSSTTGIIARAVLASASPLAPNAGIRSTLIPVSGTRKETCFATIAGATGKEGHRDIRSFQAAFSTCAAP